MIDIRSLKGLLSSMAAISRINYQILDNKGAMIFSTRGELPGELSSAELHNLSDRIIGQKVFRYTICNNHNFLCGMPLINGQEIVGALVAFDQNPHRSSRYDAGHEAEASHAGKMENFLGYLATFYEENLTSREEIAEMAQELDQNFENLYLYA